jgi:hypothetical protein
MLKAWPLAFPQFTPDIWLGYAPTDTATPALLLPLEVGQLTGRESPKRRREFCAGRLAARRAAARAGVRDPGALLSAKAGEAIEVGAPRWSASDLCVSLSHSRGLAVAAVSMAPVGVDVELRPAPLPAGARAWVLAHTRQIPPPRLGESVAAEPSHLTPWAEVLGLHAACVATLSVREAALKAAGCASELYSPAVDVVFWVAPRENPTPGGVSLACEVRRATEVWTLRGFACEVDGGVLVVFGQLPAPFGA